MIQIFGQVSLAPWTSQLDYLGHLGPSSHLIFYQVNSALFISGYIDAVILTTIRNFICLECTVKWILIATETDEKQWNIQKIDMI